MTEDEENCQEHSREITGKENTRNVTEGMEISKLESDWNGKEITHNLISIMLPLLG